MLGTTLSAVALSASVLLAPTLTPGATGTSETSVACAGVAVVVDTSALPARTDEAGSAASAIPASTGVVGCADDVWSGSVDGLDALHGAGVSVEGTAQWGSAFVCRVDGRPGAEEDVALPDGAVVRETCARTPSTRAYWSLWTAAPGTGWEYAQTGVADLELVPGSALGLVFSVGLDVPSPPGVSAADASAGLTEVGWTARASAPDDGATAEQGRAEGEEGDSPTLLVVSLALVLVMVAASVVLARRRR